MKKKIKFAGLALAGLATAALAAGQADFQISGSRAGFDKQSGQQTIEDARLLTAGNSRINADRASFAQGRNGDAPDVIALSGHVSDSTLSAEVLISDDAKYYPGLDTISASSMKVRNLMASPSVVISYTCSAGTLYGNGVAVPGNSVCTGGGYQISCSGNQVVYRNHVSSCQ